MRRSPAKPDNTRYLYFWLVVLAQTTGFTLSSVIGVYIGYDLVKRVPTGYEPKQSPDDIAKVTAPTALLFTVIMSIIFGCLSQNTAKTRLKENIRNTGALAGITPFAFSIGVGVIEGIINKQSAEEGVFISSSVFTGMAILMTLFAMTLAVGYKCKNCIYTEKDVQDELTDVATTTTTTTTTLPTPTVKFENNPLTTRPAHRRSYTTG